MMGPTAFLPAQSLLKQPEDNHTQLQPSQKGACQGFPSPSILPPRQYISKSQESDLAQLLYKNSEWVFANLFCNPGVYHNLCEYFFHSVPASWECQWKRHTPYFGELAADQSCWTKNYAKTVLALIGCWNEYCVIVSFIINIISLVFIRINFILMYESVTPQKKSSLFGIIFTGREEISTQCKQSFFQGLQKHADRKLICSLR